jgi:hypothetical protein
MRRLFWIAGLITVTAFAAYGAFEELFDGAPEHPAIGYQGRSSDPVAELNRKIQEGAAQLTYDETGGYLRSVLQALHVPVESQIVAFSKTSVQAARIGPRNPRTLFFNDAVVVGWVRGGFIELAAQDPQQGVVFYTLEQSKGAHFERRDGCLGCHLSYATLGVPGMLLRSVFPAADGTAEYQAGSYVTDHRSPMEQRWGGWYVTGSSGAVRHLGNAIVSDLDKPESMVSDGTLHLESLNAKLDASLYLSPYSDIAALMVFDHQMRMMNLLTRLNWETRYGLYQEKMKLVADPAGQGGLSTRLHDAVNEFVDYLLFVDEARINSTIRGTSGFEEKFPSLGPRDGKGRSLRELDLEHRLLRYPCSYMIYSDAFESLPPLAKEAIYKRMWEILSGVEKGPKYARLTTADRSNVVEILHDTKKDLPGYFR